METGNKTRVYLTIDVECTEERMIRGRAEPPHGYASRVWGQFANQARELGIGMIMDEFEACDLRGSFFVEALCADYFGIEGLRDVCTALSSRGHDVQLHLHPNLKHARWLSNDEPPPLDNMADFGQDEQAAMLNEGVDILVECGIGRDDLIAFRAGNFGANNETWKAMAECGLRLGSNVNLTAMPSDCCIELNRPEVRLFDTGAGVWELPVSNFRERAGCVRHLEICAVSLSEMTHYLRVARQLGVGEVTVLMHPAEFFFMDRSSLPRGYPNKVNMRRLCGLCRYLRDHDDQYEVETVGALGRRLPFSNVDMRGEIPSGNPWLKPWRVAEQMQKRVLRLRYER